MRPVLRRLSGLGRLPPEQARRIEALGQRVQHVEPKATIQTESHAPRRPRYLVSGWACRQRHLADGRRQIFDFLLPGDGIGVAPYPQPLAATTTIALTRLEMVDAGDILLPEALQEAPELAQLVTTAASEDERRLLDHIVRLGRMTAAERTAHLFLELHERLAEVGLATETRFPFPLTQETLADMLGLSIVHINRTLQDFRREDLISIRNGQAVLLNRDALASLADYGSGGPAALEA